MSQFVAGAATADITPTTPQFLYGYPHVPRTSTGVHDPLSSSALCLSDGKTAVLFIANDVIFITKAITARVRERIAAATGVPAGNIMVTATHTHSGPVIVHYLSNEDDPAVPEPDPAYIQRLEDGIAAAAAAPWPWPVRPTWPWPLPTAPAWAAIAATRPAFATQRCPCCWPGNRRWPVHRRHARVQHASHRAARSSTLIGADFPRAVRAVFDRTRAGWPMSGDAIHRPVRNQSPRHVIRPTPSRRPTGWVTPGPGHRTSGYAGGVHLHRFDPLPPGERGTFRRAASPHPT